jgi:hypothetical protein
MVGIRVETDVGVHEIAVGVGLSRVGAGTSGVSTSTLKVQPETKTPNARRNVNVLFMAEPFNNALQISTLHS